MTARLFATLDTAGYVALLLFHVSVATSATLLNALCIAALIGARLPLKQARFLYVLSTCVSDLCCGVSWFYAGIFDVDDASGRLDTYFIQPSFAGVSCLSVLCAQVDRYHAIKSPFAYVRRVTRCRTLLVISLCWLAPLVPIGLINAGPKTASTAYQGISTMIANVAMFAIMVGMNVSLCLITRSHAERAGRQQDEPNTAARSSSSVFAVALMSTALWSPSYICLVLCTVFKLCLRFPNNGLNPMTILRTLTSVTTPAINVAYSRAIKKSVSRLMPRFGARFNRSRVHSLRQR